MDDTERRGQDRRQDDDKARQVRKAMEIQRSFGDNAAQRYLTLRGIIGESAQRAVLEAGDRRKAERRRLAAAAAH